MLRSRPRTCVFGDARLPDLFWAKVRIEDGCWIWMAALTPNGYPIFNHDGKTRSAYVFAFDRLVGEDRDGMDLDHTCRRRACVNPDCLDVVTHRVNLLRGETIVATNARKTHCVHGHSLAEAYVDKHGVRHCRACTARRTREHRARKADA